MSPRLIRSRSEPEPQMSHTDSDCHPETLIYDCKPETLIYPSLNTLISKVAISFFPSLQHALSFLAFLLHARFPTWACSRSLPPIEPMLACSCLLLTLFGTPACFSHRTLYVQEHVRMLVRNKYVTQKTAGKDIGKFKSLMGERYSRVLLCTHRRSQCCCK